jgi:hypothetical protein
MASPWKSRASIWLLVAILAGIGVAAQSQSPNTPRNPNFKDGGYSETLDRLQIPHNKLVPTMKPVDLSTWPKDGAHYGPPPVRLKGAELGLSPNQLAGVRRVSLEEVRKMDVARQGSGLFVVGIDFVPRELPEILKAKGLRLDGQGRLLDRDGAPVAAFITSEVYRTGSQKQASQKQNALGGLLTGLADLFASPAEAASPFPWACYSFTPWAVYHGGFHRWYEADTWIAAYGADAHGGCSGGSPHTRIDYLQTRAAVGWPGSLQYCFTCEAEHSHDEWDVGWFWPAHGIPITTHSGVWADGSFSFSRTASLTW